MIGGTDLLLSGCCRGPLGAGGLVNSKGLEGDRHKGRDFGGSVGRCSAPILVKLSVFSSAAGCQVIISVTAACDYRGLSGPCQSGNHNTRQ